ncbi:MAG: hypothetical protein HYU99_03570 [Deltaproteobacteria bacterium]|nr:hypothetical protein [Deltaproteobacteria bacterium]
MKSKNIVLCTVLALLTAHCANQGDSASEAAQFALDQGDYETAITLATNAITGDPDNVTAYRILGSAYLGRSNIDFLDVEEGILDLDEDTAENFSAIADVLPANGNLADLRLAIEALEAAPGITDDSLGEGVLADAAFDLALMQTIEHYALGVYGSNFKTSFDVTDITAAQATQAQGDLVDFDNFFIGSGVASDEDFLDEIRQTFCMLEPITAGEGFTTAEFQALVGCQLEPTSFDPTTVTADIATCAALDPGSQTAGVQACYDEDTNL